MKLRVVAIWLCLLLTTVLCGPSVGADALVSGPTNLPIRDVSPLMITSHRTELGGVDISFLEVYNNGKTLQKLSDWTIKDKTNDRLLTISERNGYIEPSTHVVIAKSGAVSGATYRITGWSKSVLKPQAIANIELENPNYLTADTVVSLKYVDTWMMRSYLKTGYSSVTFEPTDRSLFDDGLYAAPDSASGLQIVEIYPYSSSCDPFDGSILCSDYVKLLNTSNHVIRLDDYVLRTDSSSASRTSSNTISLEDNLMPGEYRTIATTDNGSRLSLTNSGGYVWLEDTWALTSYPETLARYEPAGSALQGYSYATDANGTWQWTTTPSPLSANIITPVAAQVCADGKYLNPDTNRCRTMEETLNTLTSCEEGSERNLVTNRCRKIASSTTSSLTPCQVGQVRSPETNRCRSADSEASGLTPCKDGYERNPETNRCRKGAVAGVSTNKYPVEPYEQSGNDSTVWWAIAAAGAVAVGYGVWEWRQELATVGSKLRTLVTRHKN